MSEEVIIMSGLHYCKKANSGKEGSSIQPGIHCHGEGGEDTEFKCRVSRILRVVGQENRYVISPIRKGINHN